MLLKGICFPLKQLHYLIYIMLFLISKASLTLIERFFRILIDSVLINSVNLNMLGLFNSMQTNVDMNTSLLSSQSLFQMPQQVVDT